MSSIKIVGPALPNIPWEERSTATQGPVWRYSRNPIIPRDLIPTSNSIFNSAATPFNGAFAGVFRCDDICRNMVLHAGRSENGFDWTIDHHTIQWIRDDPDVEPPTYAYDPRVCWLEDRYYVTWCNGWHGPTIGLGGRRTVESSATESSFAALRDGDPFLDVSTLGEPE